MRPAFAAALRNRISAIGVALTTASALLFLFLNALESLGFLRNPYVGILIFVLVPALFVIGLLLIPVGLWVDRRRRPEAPPPTWPKLDLKDSAARCPTVERTRGGRSATAIGVTQAFYRHNVFPSMKIGWGTYSSQLGHTTSSGCFRCHDESHKTRDGVTIRQDCESCHAIE